MIVFARGLRVVSARKVGSQLTELLRGLRLLSRHIVTVGRGQIERQGRKEEVRREIVSSESIRGSPRRISLSRQAHSTGHKRE